MSENTGIEWTDATWNPISGCTEVSPGCDHCYAKTFAERWRGTPGHYFERGFDVQLRPDKLDQPLRWKKPRKIFVNSMSDLFHDAVPDDYIARVFAVMAYASRHAFQILTKRHARMRSLLSSERFVDLFDIEFCKLPDWVERYPDPDDAGHLMDGPLPNVWLGVSTENQQWADIRIPALLDTPAAVRFISAEPLLGPVKLQPGWLAPSIGCALWNGEPTAQDKAVLNAIARAAVRKHDDTATFIDWVIVGGESGRQDRPMHVDWARGMRDQCVAASVPFLFKQWGETVPLGQMTDAARQRWDDRHGCDVYPGESLWRVGKKAAGRELDGRTWDQYPETVAVSA